MSLSSLLRILLARWWITAALVVVCVGAMVVVSLLLPRKYTASTELIMEGKVQDRVTGELVPARSGYMSTQAEIIRSRKVASRVYEYLPADLKTLVQSKADEVQEGEPKPEAWLAGHVRANLTVSPGSDSNVMTVSMTSEDPDLAAGTVNALAQAYIDTAIELRAAPAQRFSKWYQGQLEVLRERLREARRDFSSFQKEHGIVGLTEQLDLQNTRLSELSSLLVQAQDQSTQDALRGGADNRVIATVDSPVVQSLRTELARAEAELEDLSTRYGSRHPEYRRQISEVEALRQSLANEQKLVASGLSSTADVSESRLKELQAAFDAQKQKVLDLKGKRDELELLQQEVHMAEEAYNAVAGRASANSLESRLAETSVTVLNQAIPPSLPSSPNVKLNLVIATALGLLLGIAVSLIMELTNRRVRSYTDIEEMLGLPVLAYLPDSPGVDRHREAQTV